MTAARVLYLTVDDMKMVTRATTPHTKPHLKYPGKRTPTSLPAISRLNDLKMVGVRTKVKRDVPPTQQATARR